MSKTNNSFLDKWTTLVHLTWWRIRRRAHSFLASSWLASSPGSWTWTWTGARSRCGPGPGAGWGVCPSYLFLGVVGGRRWVGVVSWGCRFRARSRSTSGLSPRPLPVSDNETDSSRRFCDDLNFSALTITVPVSNIRVLLFGNMIQLRSDITTTKTKISRTCRPRGSCFSLFHTSVHETCRNKWKVIFLFPCKETLQNNNREESKSIWQDKLTLEDSLIVCGGDHKKGCAICIGRSCGCASVGAGCLVRSRRIVRICPENASPSTSSGLVLMGQTAMKSHYCFKFLVLMRTTVRVGLHHWYAQQILNIAVQCAFCFMSPKG